MEKKNYFKKYNLVDFASRYQKGFRNNVVPVTEIPKLLKKYRYNECYSTFFLYSNDILEYMKSNIRKGRPSVAGFSGKTYATMFPVDIDSEDLNIALRSARELIDFLMGYWGVLEELSHVYFSGAGGFHITLDCRIFGDIKPSEDLYLVFWEMRKKISERAKLKNKGTVDYAIKDRVRLFRLPNTKNKSGLLKVQLTIDELFDYKIDEIKSQARTQRRLIFTDESGLISTVDEVEPIELAKELYEESLDEVNTRKTNNFRFNNATLNYELEGVDPLEILCDAKKKIWNTQIKPGKRNEAALRLASQFRLSGFEKDKCLYLINWWNKKRKIDLPEEEINTVVESVFSSDHVYSFGCRDELLDKFCPFHDKIECRHYRAYRGLRSVERTRDE
jgi:hypothetical protein